MYVIGLKSVRKDSARKAKTPIQEVNVKEIKESTTKIYQGHVLDVLPIFPSGIFNCCITSPPYWGLRDYGIKPIVWGGDEDCEHEWGDQNQYPTKCGTQGSTEIYKYPSLVKSMGKPQGSSFCLKCNAWFGCLGLEPTPDLYVEHLTGIFRMIRRVLRKDGTVWLNLGDSYAGYHGNKNVPNGAMAPSDKPGYKENMRQSSVGLCGLKPKDLCGIPWRVALALQADGWWLRSDIIWHKPNPMPESVRDRPTKSHEYIFLLSKSQKYYYDADAIRERHQDRNRPDGFKGKNGIGARYNNQGWSGGKTNLDKHRNYNAVGRNKRTVWTIPTQPFPKAHFAVFPEKLVEPCTLAGCRPNGIILDPFMGAGTTGLVANKLGRNCVGIEMKEEYIEIAKERLNKYKEAKTPKGD